MRLELMIRALVAGVLTAAALSAQAPEPGTAIHVPVPVLTDKELRQYNVVELSGAEPAGDDLLVDGELPLSVLEYLSSLGAIRQRLVIYENGLVTIALDGAGARMRKRVKFPPQAVESYREFFASVHLEKFQVADHGIPDRDQAMLRVVLPGAEAIERKFRSTAMLPEPVERLRQVLQDLMRALSEDREVTNPIIGYLPKLGDILVGDDQKTYRVLSVMQEGKLIELASTSEPVRRFVAAADLHLYFIGARPSKP